MVPNPNRSRQAKGNGNPEVLVGPPAPVEAPTSAEALKAEVSAGASARVDAQLSLKGLKGLRTSTEKREYDDKTLKLIQQVDPLKPLAEQEEEVSALSDVTLIMLAAILYSNPELDISNFKNVPLFFKALAKTAPRPAEVAAYNKLCEIRGNDTAPLTRTFHERWPGMVESARNIAPKITTLVNSPFDVKEPVKEEEKGGVIEWVKHNPGKFLGWTAVGAVGSYLAYAGISKLVRWFNTPSTEETSEEAKKTEEKKSEAPTSWLGKITTAIKVAVIGSLTSILATVGLGRILGSEKVENLYAYFKEHGFDISKNRFSQAFLNFSKGEWEEGFKVLWEGGDTHATLHKEFADQITKETAIDGVVISPALLFDVGKKNYLKWIDKKSDDSTIRTVLKGAAETIGWKPPGFDYFVTDPLKEENQMVAIQNFLRKRQDTIKAFNLPADATVDDVLLRLGGKTIPATSTPAIIAAGSAEVAAGAVAPGTAPTATAQNKIPSAQSSLEKHVKGEKPSIDPTSLVHLASLTDSDATTELREVNLAIARLFDQELLPEDEVHTIFEFAKAQISQAEIKVMKELNIPKQIEQQREINEFAHILKKAEGLKKMRTQNLNEYEASVKREDGIEVIKAKAEVVLVTENALREELDHLRARKGVWAIMGTIAAGVPAIARFVSTAGPFMGYGWYLTKKNFKRPVTVLLEAFELLKPGDNIPKIEKLAKRMRAIDRLNARKLDLEQLIHIKESSFNALMRELGLSADVFSHDKLAATLSSLEITGGEMTDPKAAAKHELLELVHMNHRKELLAEKLALAEMEKQLLADGKIPHETPAFLAKKNTISAIERDLVHIESHKITYAVNLEQADLQQKIHQEKGHLTSHNYKELDDIERAVTTHQENIDRLMKDRVKELERTVDPARRQVLAGELSELAQARGRLVKSTVAQMDGWWKRVRQAPGNLVRGITGELNETAVVTRYRQFVQRILVRMTGDLKNNPLVKIIPKSGGSFVMYAASFGVGMVATHDNFTGWKDAAKQAAFDLAPFTGTYSDFYALKNGKEYMSGREVSGGARALRGVFMVAGGLSDIATLAGVGLLGRGILSGLKATRAVGEAGKIARAIEKARAVATAGKEAVVAAREENAIYKGLLTANHSIGRRVAIGGMAAGVTMTLVPILTEKLSSEMQELLGTTAKEIDQIQPSDLSAEHAAQQVKNWVKKSGDDANDEEDEPEAPPEGQAHSG